MDPRRGYIIVASAAVVLATCGVPSAAVAHGPLAPVASDYLAKPTQVPAGVDAKVIDGDQRMWLRIRQPESVVILDYRGTPYLRISASGVAVNGNSAMYYLNQTPTAGVPPASLNAETPPAWRKVSGAREYSWHDGRLHALATSSSLPGASYVGRWTIPMLIDGQRRSFGGVLLHAARPSIAWFWPIVVMVACVCALLRLRRTSLDERVERTMAIAALVALGGPAASRAFHGRPGLSALALVEFALVVCFVIWGIGRVICKRPGFFTFFVIAALAGWEGTALLPTLLHGFVLSALPACVVRATVVICLGSALCLLLVTFRLAEATASETVA